MDTELKNIMEELVQQKYNTMINELNCCKCERCKIDIISHTLNNLPAKYASSLQGELLTKLNYQDVQLDMNIMTTLINAANIVRQNPKH